MFVVGAVSGADFGAAFTGVRGVRAGRIEEVGFLGRGEAIPSAVGVRLGGGIPGGGPGLFREGDTGF